MLKYVVSSENIDEIEETLIGSGNIGEGEEQDNGEDIGDYGSEDGFDGEEFEVLVESDVEDEFDESGNASDSDEGENEAVDASGKNNSGFARLFVGTQFDISYLQMLFLCVKTERDGKKKRRDNFNVFQPIQFFVAERLAQRKRWRECQWQIFSLKSSTTTSKF